MGLQIVDTASPISNRVFAQCYTLHSRQIRAFLVRAGCDADVVDDLVQETFLRAWHSRSRFSGAVEFRTWLMGIARNTARELWREKKKTSSLDQLLSADLLEPGRPEPDVAETIRAAVTRLPPKQRAAITLVYLDGLTQRDAALRSNCAPCALRRRLANGRTRLRTLLGEDGLAAL